MSLGFGTYRLHGKALEDAVINAWNAGIRSFDTAKLYRNEEQLASALQKCANESFQITTKIWESGVHSNTEMIAANLNSSLAIMRMAGLNMSKPKAWYEMRRSNFQPPTMKGKCYQRFGPKETMRYIRNITRSPLSDLSIENGQNGTHALFFFRSLARIALQWSKDNIIIFESHLGLNWFGLDGDLGGFAQCSDSNRVLAEEIGERTGWWTVTSSGLRFKMILTDCDLEVISLLRKILPFPKDILNILFHLLGYPEIRSLSE
jgi:hypothetical protein